MRNFWLIARNEYVRRGRTSAYLISTLFMAVLLMGTTILPAFLDSRQKAVPINAVVLDKTGQVAARLQAAVAAPAAPAGTPESPKLNLSVTTEPEEVLTERARKGDIAAVIIDGTFPDAVRVRFLSSKLGTLSGSSALRTPLESVVRAARVEKLGLNPQAVTQILTPLEFEERQLTAGTGERDQSGMETAIIAALSTVMMIYLVTLMNGSFVFQGVLEEKVSRVVEVMAASVRPTEMMAGKVAGLGALGLSQFAVLLAAWYGGNTVSRRIAPAAPQSIPASVLGLGLLFLVLGYILNATLMAAAASTISRMEDSQTVLFPLTMLVALPMLLVSPVISDPNGRLAVTLSLLPFFSSAIMPLRAALADVPVWQIALSATLTALATCLAVLAAARIYRAALLSFGTRPSLKQLWTYLRAG